MPLDEGRVGIACEIRGMSDDTLEECEVGLHAEDLGRGQGLLHASRGLVAIASPDDELRDHRVVEDAHLVALSHAGVEADDLVDLPGRGAQDADAAGLGKEIVGGILGAEAHLDRVAAAT